MNNKIIQNITFDDIYRLLRNGVNLDDKVASLFMNKEYIEYLVTDLIEIDNTYLKRLLQMSMIDYVKNVYSQYALSGDDITEFNELMRFYNYKIITIISGEILKTYNQLIEDQSRANYFISVTFTVIEHFLEIYTFLILDAFNTQDIRILDMIFDDISYLKHIEFPELQDVLLHEDDILNKIIKVLQQFLIHIFSNNENDKIYIDYIIKKEEAWRKKL